MEHVSAPVDSKQLMLYNFTQMERFCRRNLNRRHVDVDEVEKPGYRCYIVVKNFSNEEIHSPGKEAELYNITQDNNCLFKFTVYANGKFNRDKGFIYLKIENDIPLLVTQKMFLSVSLIDTEGNDKFTQTAAFYPEEKLRDFLFIKPFRQLISRETILRYPFELLHNDDLILCINMEIDKHNNLEIENKIQCSFEIDPDQSMYMLSLESDIGKIICENSIFFHSKLKETNVIRVLPREVEDLKNICRLLMAKYLPSYSNGTIFSLYKTAHTYHIPTVINYCRSLFKNHASYAEDASEILKLATSYNDLDFIQIIKDFQQKQTIYGKFVWHTFDSDSEDSEEKSDRDDIFSKHIHGASGEYLQCDDCANFNQCSYNFNYERIEVKFHFYSAFNVHENGKITLSLDSVFGKILCEKSKVLTNMLECLETDTEDDKIEIRESDFEALKNVYRLLMGANYIKTTTIDDIISLYEVSDFYDILLLMNVCRNLFEKHICIRNFYLIKALSKKYCIDNELDKIVKRFQANFRIFLDSARCHRRMDPLPEWLDGRSNNFVELEDFQHNFYQ